MTREGWCRHKATQRVGHCARFSGAAYFVVPLDHPSGFALALLGTLLCLPHAGAPASAGSAVLASNAWSIVRYQ